jgi:hypothetical protein
MEQEEEAEEEETKEGEDPIQGSLLEEKKYLLGVLGNICILKHMYLLLFSDAKLKAAESRLEELRKSIGDADRREELLEELSRRLREAEEKLANPKEISR